MYIEGNIKTRIVISLVSVYLLMGLVIGCDPTGDPNCRDDLIDNSVFKGIVVPLATTTQMYVTKNENVLICPYINWKENCGTITKLTVTYSYDTGQGSPTTGNMTRFRNTDVISSLNLKYNDINDENLWCFEGTLTESGTMTINARCETPGFSNIYDYMDIDINVGNVDIKESNALGNDYNRFEYGVYPEENITIALYAQNGSNVIGVGEASIEQQYLSVLNPTESTSIFGDYDINMATNESWWVYEKNIPREAAIGIISLGIAYKQTEFGGKYILYKTKPFKADIKVLQDSKEVSGYLSINDTITIDVSDLNTLYYGDYDKITSYVETENGKTDITINETNGYKTDFLLDKGEGVYTIKIEIEHSSGYKETLEKNITVKNSYVFIQNLLPDYVPGDPLIVSCTLKNAKDESMISSMKYKILDNSGKKIAEFDDSDGTVNGPVHTIVYTLPESLSTGTYKFQVEAKNGTKTTITTQEFEIKSPSEYVNVSILPDHWVTENITSLSDVVRKTFIILNNEGRTITKDAIKIYTSEDAKDYIKIDNRTITDISLNRTTTFDVSIEPKDDMPLGKYNKTITVEIYGTKINVPIQLDVQLEPDLVILNKIETTILGEITNLIEIPITNRGDYKYKDFKLESSPSASSGVKYTKQYEVPREIGAGKTEYIKFYVDRFESEGTYNITFEVKEGEDIKRVVVEMNVIMGVYAGKESLERSISALKNTIEDISAKGVSTSSISSRISSLEDDLEKVDEYINQTKYEEAKNLLETLQDSYKSISNDVKDLVIQAESQNETSENSEEPALDKEGGSKLGAIIAIFVFLVVAGVIIYTSIVPDNA